MKSLLLFVLMLLSLPLFASNGARLVDTNGKLIGILSCTDNDSNQSLESMFKNKTVKKAVITSEGVRITLNQNDENLRYITLDNSNEGCGIVSIF